MSVSHGLFAGTSTFNGASIDEVLTYLRESLKSTLSAIRELERLRHRCNDELCDQAEIGRVDAFAERLIRNLGESAANLQRLVTEIPRGVLAAHVELLEQTYIAANRHETTAARMMDDLRYDPSISSEQANWFIERVFSVAREMFVDHQDLPNLAGRLRTFVGVPLEHPSVSPNALHMLELKPNVFGLGINLNAVLGWFGSRLRRQ